MPIRLQGMKIENSPIGPRVQIHSQFYSVIIIRKKPLAMENAQLVSP